MPGCLKPRQSITDKIKVITYKKVVRKQAL